MSDDIFDNYDDDDDLDLNPENKAPSNKVERFKGKKDESYRVALLYFHPIEQAVVSAAKRKARKEGTDIDKDKVRAAIQKLLEKRAEELGKSVDELADWEKLDLSKIQFKKKLIHYQEGIGYTVSRLGLDGEEGDKVWGRLDEPRAYYFTILLVYSTDRSGNVDKETLLARSYVIPWRISGKVFNRLIDVNEKLKKLPGGGTTLAEMDLKLTCTNGEYQNFEIDFDSEALWKKASKIRSKFLPQAHALYEKMVDVRELTTRELAEKLGIGGDTGEDVGDDDMEDLLDDV